MCVCFRNVGRQAKQGLLGDKKGCQSSHGKMYSLYVCACASVCLLEGVALLLQMLMQAHPHPHPHTCRNISVEAKERASNGKKRNKRMHECAHVQDMFVRQEAHTLFFFSVRGACGFVDSAA